MRKILNEAHSELKAHNAKLIETTFLNATNVRWKFSRIEKHFVKVPDRKGNLFHVFLEELKSISKDKIAEMEKLMGVEFQNEVADEALEQYSNDLEELAKTSMEKYKERIEKGRISCLVTQFKQGGKERRGEMEELKEKFRKETEGNFEEQMNGYLKKMTLIEYTVSAKYESCYQNSETFESCLNSFVEVCRFFYVNYRNMESSQI